MESNIEAHIRMRWRRVEQEVVMHIKDPGQLAENGLKETQCRFSIEALTYRGKGNILLSGQIGDVVKESAQAALKKAGPARASRRRR